MFYKCPNGHSVEHDATNSRSRHIHETAPTCHECELIATHYNARSGEVYTWTPIVEHEQACERMQDEMDAAFDHQYFDEGGW